MVSEGIRPSICIAVFTGIGLIVTPVDVLSFHDAVVPFAWGAGLDRLLIAVTVGGAHHSASSRTPPRYASRSFCSPARIRVLAVPNGMCSAAATSI